MENRFQGLVFVTQATGNPSLFGGKNVLQQFYLNPGPGSWKSDRLPVQMPLQSGIDLIILLHAMPPE
ncbi:MAG: hypothetical protein JRH12_13450 [Deltaproteobacteria bacterium]|jgi:hypothetical protein|nr:hypothetical protein [Deltaproteobacteria bacterium]